ncbi:T9SS type A sorting domain-containing protein [Cryomorphaceae bacterium 1068]|nr:T9SS type A sorting domain-containing protein [Cryomorphaceae bacterium 1068]
MKKYFTNTFAFCAAIILSLGMVLTSQAQSCTNTIPFGSTLASSIDGETDTLSTCIYFGEHRPVTAVPIGASYEFAMPDGGYITVREGTFDGPVVGQGSGSASIFSASGADLFVHVNPDDGTCGELIGTCQVLTARCLNCDGCFTPFLFATTSLASGDNSLLTINTCNIAQEYNQVTDVPIFSGIEFTTTGDAYMTVRAGSFDGAVLGEGFSPLTVFSGFDSELYVHYTADDACTFSSSTCLVTTVQCTTCPFPDPMDGNCYNTSSFGGADLSAGTNESTSLSSCAFSTEYSEVTGVPAGENIVFTLEEPGYITVREGTPNGPVVAQGFSPVTVAAFAVTGANLYAHWTSDQFCTQGAECFDATVQCTTCPSCPDGSFIGQACDDGNPLTTGSTIQADCSCGGGGLIPENDTCEGVSTLLDCGESVSGSTDFALPATNVPSGCGDFLSDTQDVWYAFQANGSDNYVVTLETEATFDGVLYAYSGLCGTQTEIACSDAIGGGLTETVELNGLSAGIYYIQLYDYFQTGDYTVSLDCVSSCVNPFPTVNEASLSTVFTGSAFATSWDPVPNQIGCQIQVRFAGGSILGAQIVGGASAGSFNIPGSVLNAGTDYEWRVRCGCSQVPLVAGAFSSWQPFSTPGGATIASQPNPTGGLSNVTFSVSAEGYTTLEVFDMSGRMIDAVFTGNAQPNNDYRFDFDGSSLPNGVYTYRLTTGSEVVIDKFIIAK